MQTYGGRTRGRHAALPSSADSSPSGWFRPTESIATTSRAHPGRHTRWFSQSTRRRDRASAEDKCKRMGEGRGEAEGAPSAVAARSQSGDRAELWPDTPCFYLKHPCASRGREVPREIGRTLNPVDPGSAWPMFRERRRRGGGVQLASIKTWELCRVSLVTLLVCLAGPRAAATAHLRPMSATRATILR